jgi:hypothetical protein
VECFVVAIYGSVMVSGIAATSCVGSDHAGMLEPHGHSRCHRPVLARQHVQKCDEESVFPNSPSLITLLTIIFVLVPKFVLLESTI